MGGFGSPILITPTPSSGGPSTLGVVDWNGDQRPDLIVTSGAGPASLLLSNPLGGLDPSPALPGGGGLAVGAYDVNGDASLDLLLFTGGGHYPVLSDGQGGFLLSKNVTIPVADPPFGGTVGDFNGDQHADLAVLSSVNSSVGILLGDGRGGFGAGPRYAVGTSPNAAVAADLNGDSKLDLIVGLLGGQVSVLLGDGLGGLDAPRSYPAGSGSGTVWLAAADVNGDQKLDVLFKNYYSSFLYVFLGDGNGGLSAAIKNYNPSSTGLGALGDFNGDHILDFVLASYTENVLIFLGDGKGGFAAPTSFPAGGEAHEVTVGDLNGDDKLDLVVANYDSSSISVLLGDGRGTFSAPAVITTSYGAQSPIIQDFNGDGRPDIAVSGTIQVLLGDGMGGFPTRFKFGGAGGQYTSLVTGDFTDDKKPDLIATNSYPGSERLTLMTNLSK